MAEASLSHVRFEVGLRNAVASFAAGSHWPPLTEGVVLDFKAEHLSQFLGLVGFHEPDPDGRWTSGNHAAFKLPLRVAADRGSVLRIKLTPLVTPTFGQNVKVRLNQGPEQLLTFPPGPMTATVVDLALDAETDLVQAEISLLPVSPRALGINSDERQLALMFHSLELVSPSSVSAASSALAKLVPGLKKPERPAFHKLQAGRKSSVRWIKSRIKPLAAHIRDFLTSGVRTEVSALTGMQQRVIEAQQQRVIEAQQQRLNIQPRVYEAERAEILARFDRLFDKLDRSVDENEARSLEAQRAGAELNNLVIGLHGKLDTVLFRSSMLKLDDDSILLRSRSGYLLVPASDLHLVAAINDSGLLEPGLNKLLVRLLGPGTVFVDVGANVGLHTLAVGRAGATVHAFEPTPKTFRLLTKSVDLNSISSRTTVHNVALGAVNAEIDLNLSRICGHNSIYPLETAEAVVRVPIRQLDDMLPAGQRVDLTKIDVEGAELDVLKGMSRVIEENPDQVIIAEFGPSHLKRLGIPINNWLDAFFSLGFEGFAILEPDDVTVPLDTVRLDEVESINIVFVRRGSPMYEKIASS